MDWVRRVKLATLAFFAIALLASGPLVSAIDLTPRPAPDQRLGDGTANASVVGDPAAAVRFDRGRFGTNVTYLRIPPAVVDVHAVTGRPRLVYRVEVPGLSFDRSVTRQLTPGDSGRLTLRMDPRAFRPASLTYSRYRVHVTVRVQSFESDRTVYDGAASPPVPRP